MQGTIEQEQIKQEIASIMRLLQFASKEIDAFGFVDSATEIRNTIEHLQHKLYVKGSTGPICCCCNTILPDPLACGKPVEQSVHADT